ncbi:pilus assembly protein PilW [Herbaspirillum sp. HC18]|nr:pilus assembly protein PilW [Herbaspirillum sp. HC18]
MTLVELMVSMAIGMLVMLIATALLLSTKSGYVMQTDSAQMLDSGRYALDIIARSVRQGALSDWEAIGATAVKTGAMDVGIFGMDARSLKGSTEGVAAPVTKSINGSDVLAIRFSGSGKGEYGDGSVLNCAGFGVGASGSESRGWSIFYVAEDASGEPELYCKYRGEDSWSTQAIARGVESFQVLYALDTDDDGVPNTFMNAAAIDTLDGTLALAGNSPSELAADMQKKSYWRKVVDVKVALLVRGAQPIAGEKSTARYDLFGKAYSDLHASHDPGVMIQASNLPKAVRNRARKVFSATIHLRQSQQEEPA